METNVIEFAKQEFAKYFKLVCDETNPQVLLRIDESLKYCLYNNGCDLKFDDGFSIYINQGKGEICGINERSVLLGVYRFFKELGCRFLKPGKSGESLVKRSINECTVKLKFAPKSRHRGIAIEGANSLENILDMIDWAPKVGFSAYFTQFRNSYTFFERWYNHENNEFASVNVYNEALNEYNMQRVISEIKKRGLLYHAVGHGWTCEPLGISSGGWHKQPENILSEDKKQLLAQVKGKREFFGGIPLNTQLCYGNKKVTKLITEEIVRYASEHKEVDILHFWLADNYNNFCECPLCSKLSPTDHYVKLLNEIDRLLTEKKLDTKIVFLIYFELLWPPITQKINNPSRFIMMFAPITRTYMRSLLENGQAPKAENCVISQFKHNELKLPTDTKENLAFLYEWQKHFNGDSFVFDYHLMWDIFKDYGTLTLSQVIYEDTTGLEKLGLNGLISCQVQRAFFPSALCMNIMADGLSSNAESYESIKNDYFNTAYGEYAEFAYNYFQDIAKAFDFAILRGEAPITQEFGQKMNKSVPIMLNNYKQALTKILSTDLNPICRESLMYINEHNEMLLIIASLLSHKAEGKKEAVLKGFKEFEKHLYSTEPRVQSGLDTYFCHLLLKHYFEAV